jgi:hypothetical protein
MGHFIFEYLYRDAGNFKAWGELLLDGELSEADEAFLRSKFEGGEFFIAEQLGIPPLYEAVWSASLAGPSEELDHVWHEFHAIRPASEEEVKTHKPWGSASRLITVVEDVDAWDLSLSRNYALGRLPS